MTGASRQPDEEIVRNWGVSDHLDNIDCVGKPRLTLAELTLLFQHDDLVGHPAITTVLNNAAWALNECLWAARSDLADINLCLSAIEGFFQVIATHPKRCPTGLLYMFWDIACGRGECGDEAVEENPVCHRLLMTLSSILGLESRECQMSALHGLNHMPSRATSQIIHRHYRALINNEVRGYAGEALRGQAL